MYAPGLAWHAGTAGFSTSVDALKRAARSFLAIKMHARWAGLAGYAGVPATIDRAATGWAQSEARLELPDRLRVNRLVLLVDGKMMLTRSPLSPFLRDGPSHSSDTRPDSLCGCDAGSPQVLSYTSDTWLLGYSNLGMETHRYAPPPSSHLL